MDILYSRLVRRINAYSSNPLGNLLIQEVKKDQKIDISIILTCIIQNTTINYRKFKPPEELGLL